MIQEGIATMWSLVLDCVFPESCLGCGMSDAFLCTNCRQNELLLNPAGVFRCPTCGTDSPLGTKCESCSSAIEQIIALSSYKPGTLAAELIEALKYNYSSTAIAEINAWLIRSQSVISKLGEIDLVIPIPLHARRLAERGFNQSDTIARTAAEIVNAKLSRKTITRVRATKQQAKLNRTERQKNMHAAFACVQPSLIKDKSILLVDDVYTTGSTMHAAAEVLLAAGAKKIRGLTLARG